VSDVTNEPTSDGDTANSDEPTNGESEKPPVLSKEASGRDLTLADFFAAPDEWRDGRFDVAGQKNVTGIGGDLSYCQEDQDENHPTLELRLANNFSKITMKVGQNDLSQSSDAVLNVQLKGNGKYTDSTRVPFNKVDAFSAPVSDVNALKIEVWMGGEQCEEPIGAVITGLRVE
jgi:hypothetical protein